ncbi:MAG TPA: acetylornithine transaminase [Bacillales bacterium]|nr:acetylornithine transaminase [Bacillales bacterium]
MSRLFPNYGRWELALASGKGAHVVDTDGNAYLDFICGIGVTNLGHCHPDVTEAVQAQLHKVWHVSNLFQIESQEEVARKLTEHCSGDAVVFCNSGAEANEAAMKLARKHTGNHKIITFAGSFHGRTLATLAATGQEKVKTGFGPQLETFIHVPFNDIEALREAIDDETAAVMVEAVQGEGGIHPADADFLAQVEVECRKHGALLIVDEVQTGIGRTGKAFAYQHYGISPDVITAAKGLGNGFPVGAMIGKAELANTFGPGTHGSTFGGNPLAMAAASAVLDVVFRDGFLSEVERKGRWLMQMLHEQLQDVPEVTAVRGKGLMVGIECEEAAAIVTKVREKGLLVLLAGSNVVRLLPPLIVTDSELREAVSAIVEAFDKK